MKITSVIKSNKILGFGLILSFLLIILSILLIAFGHSIISKAVQNKNNKIDLTDPVTQKRYNRLMSDFNNLKEERAALQAIRIPKDNVVLLVQYLDDIASKTGVKQVVNIVTNSDEKGKKEYSIPTVKYELNVSGGLPAIKDYLSNLIRSPFFLKMESLKILAPDENSTTGDYLAKIFVVVATKE